MIAFSEQVTTPEWLADARGWIAQQLAAAGVELRGEAEQVRVRPWSTLLRQQTDEGLVWFKAGAPSFAFEAGVQQAMAELVEGSAPAPLAVDASRGWMITRDHGPALGEEGTPSTDDWCGLVRRAAGLQQSLLPHAARLASAGLPDRTPATVPARLDLLLERLERCPEGHPEHVSEELRDRLRAARPDVAGSAARLAGSPLPPTWNHGDLHPWNAYRADDRLALFDLGDGSWASAMEVLVVPYEVRGEDVAWSRVLATYREAWGLEARGGGADRLWRDTLVVHAVNRAQTWSDCLAHATPAEAEEWGGEPREHLAGMLPHL